MGQRHKKSPNIFDSRDYAKSTIPTSLISEEITDPFIMKFKWPTYQGNGDFTNNIAMSSSNVINVSDLISDNGDTYVALKDVTTLFTASRGEDGSYYVLGQYDQNFSFKHLEIKKFDVSDTDDFYFYINPKKQKVMLFKNGLASSNIVLSYSGNEVPSPCYLFFYCEKTGSQIAFPFFQNGVDTSLAGGNIIIPPENWQYA